MKTQSFSDLYDQHPNWVAYGGFTAALIAGAINSVGLLSFKHQAVSHLTGVSTFLSLEMAAYNSAEIIHLLCIMLSFLAGAVGVGIALGKHSQTLSQGYVVCLGLEALVLLCALAAFYLQAHAAYYFCSLACGLQNALTSHLSHSLLRTTHVSGLFTDIGLMLGQWLSGTSINPRRLWLYSALIAGFIVGGVLGALLFHAYTFWALWLPIGLAIGLTGLCAGVLKQRKQPA